MTITVQQSKVINIPELRFPDFSDEWSEGILGDICTILKGKGIAKDDIIENGNNKCIRYGELYTEYSETINYVKSRTNVSKSESLLSKKNDILIPSSGETAIDIATLSCLKEDSIILGGDLNILRLREDQNGDFFAYYLSNFQNKNIAKIAQGHSVVHLYASHLKSLKIKFPSAHEQQKIASCLMLTSEWVQNLKIQKKSLESYKQAITRKIFAEKINFQNDNKNEFPKWQEKELGQVADIIMGQSPNSVFYNVNGAGIYLIQGNADIANRKTKPRNWTTQITKKCKVGDIIMTVRAPVGYIAKSLHDACIGRGVCAIRNNETSDIGFLYQFLLNFEKKWMKLGQGSTFTAVNTQDIKKLKLLVPSLQEQQKIANLLSSIDNIIELKQRQVNQAKQWLDGLMQMLFA